RTAVLARQRDARLRRRAEYRAPAELLPARSRPRAPVQDRQAAALDRRARLQRAQRVPARRRTGQHLLAGLRFALQLAVPAVPPAAALRTIVRSSFGCWVLSAGCWVLSTWCVVLVLVPGALAHAGAADMASLEQ